MQYLIVFTGQSLYDDLLFEDLFYEQLEKNQAALGFSSISYHFSDLTHLVISYALYLKGMLEQLDENLSYKVIKLTYPDDVLALNHEIDELFRNCVSELKEPIHSTCFYLIEKNCFHRVSRRLSRGKVVDDEHLKMKGAIVGNPDMFYRHFYNNPYTDEQIAEITKMMLSVGAPKAVNDDF